MTKPARWHRRGARLAAGTSSAAIPPRMAQKPARIRGCMQASVPPARITSASPRRMISAPSPTACDPVAQAETGVVRASQPERDGELPARGVDEDARQEIGRHAIGLAFLHDLVLLHDPEEAADRRAEDDAGACRVEPVQIRVRERFARGEREQDVAVEPPRLLRRRQPVRRELLLPRRQPSRESRWRRTT